MKRHEPSEADSSHGACMITPIDWAELQSRTGCPHNVYSDSVGLRAIEWLLGEAFIRETTRGAVEWHPQCLLMMGKVLDDPDVAEQAVQLLEKQLWYSDSLREDAAVLRMIEMAEHHADPAVRETAMLIRERYFTDSDFTDT